MALSDDQILMIKEKYKIFGDSDEFTALKVYNYTSETYVKRHWERDYLIGSDQNDISIWSSKGFNQVVTDQTDSLIDSDNVWVEWTGE